MSNTGSEERIGSPEMQPCELSSKPQLYTAVFSNQVHNSPWLIYATIALVLLVCIAIRLIPVSSRPLAVHEDCSHEYARAAHFERLMQYNYVQNSESNGFLYYAGVLKPVESHFGKSNWALRLPSVFFGGCSLWLLFLIGRRISGIRGGIFALILYGVNSVAIVYDGFARFYAVNTTLDLFASYLVLLII